MPRDRSLDIAVTGLAARFPGGLDLAGWWSALLAGEDLLRRYDRAELLDVGVPETLVDDRDYVPVGGHLPGADRFDNTLFQVSRREAELMDPQHRQMLELAWAALEDAGSGPDGEGLVTGIYASTTASGYLRAMLEGGPLDPATLDDALHATEPDFLASRIAYKLGRTGPALAVQTACSSSLVGVHLATQALLAGDCDQAVVVAAGIAFPQAGYLHLPGGVLSESGACRPFDHRADGVVSGSGAVCVVLRRLADVAGGPEPYGVILGTAVNNDGAAKAGYYAPSVAGQEEVIRAALLAADVDASSVGYLETHGTGTPIGDPIEWSAASAALSGMGARAGQVAVGALKANVGHLDAAAGVAGLIKALFVVRTGIVPPVAGFTRLNPLLDGGGTPLHVPTEAAPWAGPLPRRAAVSAFGIGGTNAHAVVEQAPAVPAAPPSGQERPRLVILSAAEPDALARAAAGLAEHLEILDTALEDVAFTLAHGRTQLAERLAATGRTPGEIAARLTSAAGAERGRRPAAGPAPVVFVLPGQGVQRPGMAAAYAAALPGFAAALERCLAAFEPDVGAAVRRAVVDGDLPPGQMAATELAQPALFAVGYAAATALTGLGVEPAALIGHSLGEITAACLAGIMDLRDAARFVVARGRAMQACPPGGMLAVGCGEDQAAELIAASGRALEIAAVNAPDSTVVAGPLDDLAAFEAGLGEDLFTRRLRTSHAFHTAAMAPAGPLLAEAVAGVSLRPPRLPIAQNLTGRLLEPGSAVQADGFVDHVLRPVRFADGVGAIAAAYPAALAVEIGPGRALSALVEAMGIDTIALAPGRTDRPAEEVLASIGALWAQGQPVAVRELCRGGRLTHLPTYPFAGPRWIAPEVARHAATRDDPAPAGRRSRPVAAAPAAAPPAPAPEAGGDPGALLASLWRELLGEDELAPDSDFFSLGGDSLLITRLARRVNQELGIRVPVRDMLAGRTLRKQAEIVSDLVEASAGR